MLDLAISIGTDPTNITIVDTNRWKDELKAPGWPSDSDFQLVAFNPSGESCEVVEAEDLARDIGRALMRLGRLAPYKGRKPDWYRRLELCATRGSLS
jgi:hypothetical protein